MSTAPSRAKPRPAGGKPTGPRRPPAGRRQPAWRRRAPWVGVAAVVAIMLAVVISNRGDGGGDGAGAGSFVGGDLHTLVADPSTPERLFVGGHEAAAASTDGGRTWAQVPSLRGADAMGWAFDGDTIWMGGHPGLRRSTDSGRTFAPAGGELSSTDVHALGGGGGVLYAASPSRGFLASTDDGRSWEVRSAEAGQGFMGGIALDRANAQHIFAPDMQAGIVESTDGGRSWRRLGSPGMAMSVAVDDNGSIIMAGNGNVARSTDGGRTWTPLDVPDGTMVVSAGPGGVLYAASLAGTTARVSTSRDGGATWEANN